ncbi:hypothetical protein [Priestia aryabhattai]
MYDDRGCDALASNKESIRFFMKNTIIGFWIMIEKKLTFCLLDGVSDPALEKGKDIWFEVDRKARRRRGRGRRVFT